MARGTTLRERVAALEVSVMNLKESVDDLRNSYRENSRTIYKKLDNLEQHVNQMLGAIGNLDPGLSKKDRAAIYVAVITGVTSIVVTLIKVLPLLFH